MTSGPEWAADHRDLVVVFRKVFACNHRDPPRKPYSAGKMVARCDVCLTPQEHQMIDDWVFRTWRLR